MESDSLMRRPSRPSLLTLDNLRLLAVLTIVVTIVVLCVACGEQNPLPTQEVLSPAPSQTPAPTPSPTPEPKRLAICLQDEPDSLYLYGAEREAARHVWQALYDGPTDHRGYEQQAVILTEIPRLGDGASVETTTVATGDRVLATSGSVMALAPGVFVEDAAGKRKAFRGEPIRMRRMVVTFTLRSGVRWSDGEPLTADDSVYAFELAKDPATPNDKHLIERTKGYRAVDAHRVVWEGVPGFLDRTYALTFWHPLPRHAWHDRSAAELLTATASTRRPLGWGPFAVEAWRAGDSITLERNPFYFRASEGLPRVDEITFHFIKDVEKLADALLTGGCDIVTHEVSTAMDSVEVDVSAAVRVLTTDDSAWEFLAFGISPVVDYQRPDFFEDVRMRRGIAQCIDREALVKEAFTEGGRVLHSYLPPEHPAYGPGVASDEPLARWPYDPEAGRLLLAEAGWYDEDGDGLREAHGVPGVVDGTAYQVTYRTTEDPLRLRTARLIQKQLEACGIGVSLQSQPAGDLFAPGPEGDLFGRRFDLAQFSWRITMEPLCELFLSSQIPDDGGWGKPNVGGFIDSAYDQACRRALGTLPGSPDYASNHAVPQRIFSEQLPVVPLFQHQKTTLARPGVIGLAPNPSQWSELWNLEQIDIEQ